MGLAPRHAAPRPSSSPPCPLRLLALFPSVCAIMPHCMTAVGRRNFFLGLWAFKNHCLFKTDNIHVGNSSASRPMETQCFLFNVQWCTHADVSCTLFFVGHLAEEFPWGAIPADPKLPFTHVKFLRLSSIPTWLPAFHAEEFPIWGNSSARRRRNFVRKP